MVETAISVYRPRPDAEDTFVDLLAGHVAVLRSENLATDRPVLILKSPKDGTYLEIFEWKSAEAVKAAHGNQVVSEIWKKLEMSAEFLTMAQLAEADTIFPAFERADISEA